MSSVVFFRLSLSLPLLVPLPFVYWAYAVPRDQLLPMVDSVVRSFAGSLVVGGVPYLAFAIYAFIWLGSKTDSQILQRMRRAPVEFIGWLAAAFIVFFLWFLPDWDVRGLASIGFYLVIMAPFALGFGYGYVWAVSRLYRILANRGAIRLRTG